MTTEIEERLRATHPKSLETLAKEVGEVFAPVIDAFNMGFAIQEKMYRDPDTLINRLDGTMNKLLDRLDRMDAQISAMQQEQILFRKSLKEIVNILQSKGDSHGKSE